VSSRVLLVEDDLAVRDATRLLLRVEGFQVEVAASLNEALLKLRDNKQVDLLVTDYHLHDGEKGTEVIAGLRESLKMPLKSVLLTGDACSAAGVLAHDPYVRIASKPIRAHELMGLIRGLLNA
jgi:two-component system, sensor histidine kinase